MSLIMVAEDEPHIMLLIQRKLETSGYTILSITHGNDVMPALLEHEPDLVLLDIMLPGRQGLELCQEIKATLGSDAPPVILVSALGQQMDVESGLNAGADDYIIKPFSPRLLVERVEAALQKH